MSEAATNHALTLFSCGCVVSTSATQDMGVVLMKGDETRSYHTAEQCPWDMNDYRMEMQPAAQVQIIKERLPLEGMLPKNR